MNSFHGPPLFSPLNFLKNIFYQRFFVFKAPFRNKIYSNPFSLISIIARSLFTSVNFDFKFDPWFSVD